jgi:hypothetical protein
MTSNPAVPDAAVGGAPFRGLVPTLWSPSGGIHNAYTVEVAKLLAEARPEAVQLHTWTPKRLVSLLRGEGYRLVIGCGVDGTARSVTKGGRNTKWAIGQFLRCAGAAADAGADATMWNAEADWKTPPDASQRSRLKEAIEESLKAVEAAYPQLLQWHTAYDHPSFHTTYPWAAWLGARSPVRLSAAQVYAAGAAGDAGMAHRGALPRREARALASWRDGVRNLGIRPDAPDGPADLTDVDWAPYYQLHHVSRTDTIAGALRHPLSFGWALPTRSDEEGRIAFVLACKLQRAGYGGAGAIQAFQRDAGLKVDGIVGPATTQAILALNK